MTDTPPPPDPLAVASEDYFNAVARIQAQVYIGDIDPAFPKWWRAQKTLWVNKNTSEADRVVISEHVLSRLIADSTTRQSDLVGEVMLTVSQLAVSAVFMGAGGFAIQALLLLKVVSLFAQPPGQSWVGLLSEVFLLLAAYVADSQQFFVMLIFSVLRLSLPAIALAVMAVNYRVRTGKWTSYKSQEVDDGGE